MNIPQLIDTLGRNLSRIKTLALVLLVILLGISWINSGFKSDNIEKITEKVTGLNIRTDILQMDIISRDSTIIAILDSNKILKAEIAKSKSNETALNKKYNQIKGKYDGIASELIKLTSEQSYAFLDTVAYPYGGIKKFPFSEPQIKEMHKTFLEKENLITQNENLNEQNSELAHQVKLNNALNLNNELAMMEMYENRQDMDSIIENKSEIIKTTEKELKKQKRKSLFAKIGIGLGALIIGFLAGG